MGFAEGFYYGQSKLECISSLVNDVGKTVKIVSGSRTWEKQLGEDLTAVFTLPGTNKYTVSIVNSDGETEYEEDVRVGYGEYRILHIGYNTDSIKGIQSILNAHRETTELEIGDEISINVTGAGEMVYQVGAIDLYDAHDVIFVPKWLYPTTVQINSSNTNVGGFNSSALYKWLQDEFYAMLPDDVRELIVDTTQITSVGNQSTGTQPTIGKIFLPTEWETFGAVTYATSTEHTVSNSVQWPIFATASNRIKTLGKGGAANWWWECSPYASNSANFCDVYSGGAANNISASHLGGLLPCFRIRAQAQS
jgi:hypothetical protein